MEVLSTRSHSARHTGEDRVGPDLRALPAIADDMERPLAWVARRGIRLYISQILEAEETLARGDHIVEEMGREARGRREAGEQENGG